jgi:hypothetical protein
MLRNKHRNDKIKIVEGRNKALDEELDRAYILEGKLWAMLRASYHFVRAKRDHSKEDPPKPYPLSFSALERIEKAYLYVL